MESFFHANRTLPSPTMTRNNAFAETSRHRSGMKKKKKIMGTLFLGYGENRNKFEQTDLRQKRRWDGKRWRIFFFYLSVFMSQVQQASIEEIDFRWILFIHRNIYFSSSNEINSVTILELFSVSIKRKTNSYRLNL